MTTKRSKYGNIPTIIDGIKFASQREGARYAELKVLQRIGEITELQCHPKFPLWATSPLSERKQIGNYTGDFRYYDLKKKRYVIEDVKSKASKTTAYRLRKKLFEANYDTTLTEVA